VEARERLLPFLDDEIATLLTRRLTEMGVKPIFRAEATRVERGGGALCTTLSTGETLSSEKVLYAAGRNGNTSGLGLSTIGVAPDPKRGTLRVDQHFRVLGAAGGRIYAAGDVIGFPALAA